MPGHRDADQARKERADALLRRLRAEADTSREERRIVAETLADRAVERQANAKTATTNASKRKAETRKRTNQKP